jgi:hypothetical protein
MIAVALLAAAGAMLAWWLGHAHAATGHRRLVRGGDGGGLPLAQPAAEHMDAGALERIVQDPAAAGLQALLVMRHGHLIYSRYGHGIDADTVVDGGAFARALVALAAGVAVDERLMASPPIAFAPQRLRTLIETAAHQPYAAFLGNRIWSRLNAAPAWIAVSGPTAPAPADCCLHARVQDWLRVGGLLAGDGNFEDTQIVSGRWMLRMREPQASGAEGYGVALPSRRRGAPTYEAADVMLLRGPAHWRLWIVPSLHLVVLFGAPAGKGAISDGTDWDETRVPDMVLEAVLDRPAAPASSLLQQLVPGH